MIAAAGGALFAALGLPAAWLTGSMMAIVAAAMADLPVGLPARLRDVAFVLLGISMGSSATPESVTQMQAWPGSLALLPLSVVQLCSPARSISNGFRHLSSRGTANLGKAIPVGVGRRPWAPCDRGAGRPPRFPGRREQDKPLDLPMANKPCTG